VNKIISCGGLDLREWYVEYNFLLSGRKRVIVYKRKNNWNFGPEFKVQIFSAKKYEVWNDFQNMEEMIKFVKGLKKMRLYKNTLYTKKEFYQNILCPIMREKHGYDNEFRIKIINIVLNGMSTVKASKKYGLSYMTVCKWLKHEGYVFNRDTKCLGKGKWVLK
jgi:hypothetical protein